MNRVHLIDTGPIVAFLNPREHQHAWAVGIFEATSPPLLTCEAVVAEAAFLLRKSPRGVEQLMDLILRGVVLPQFDLMRQCRAVYELLRKYANVPMSLADACLVRMTELHAEAALITFDSDFSVYRRHSRLAIPLIKPA